MKIQTWLFQKREIMTWTYKYTGLGLRKWKTEQKNQNFLVFWSKTIFQNLLFGTLCSRVSNVDTHSFQHWKHRLIWGIFQHEHLMLTTCHSLFIHWLHSMLYHASAQNWTHLAPHVATALFTCLCEMGTLATNHRPTHKKSWNHLVIGRVIGRWCRLPWQCHND